MVSSTIEKMNKDILDIKEELSEIKARFNEEFELSDSAKKNLLKAREEMKNNYISHDEVMKKFG